jgi:hypothetical protein
VENGPGWGLTPGRADQLAKLIRAASRSSDSAVAARAAEAAARFNRTMAMNAYAGLIDEIVAQSGPFGAAMTEGKPVVLATGARGFVGRDVLSRCRRGDL